MTRERIENAVNVINYAINNGISVSEASIKCGYARTYIKNVKALIYEKYDNGILDDDLFELFNNAYQRYLNKYNNYRIKPDDLVDTNNLNKVIVDGVSVTSNDNELNIEWSGDVKHVKTLEDLLEVTKVNLNDWNVEKYVINKWDVTSFKNNKPIVAQNWQVKAQLVKNKTKIHEHQLGEIFIKMISDYKPPVLNVNYKKKFDKTSNEDNNLLEISIFDLHLGKLAWRGETYENYDIKIARERFLYSINSLIKRASGFSISRIVFPVGSDFFNSDTIFNTTTQGTPQDEDLRWQKTFDIGCRLIIDAINVLKQIGVPIDVIIVPGNHDFERNYYLGKFIDAWFNNDSQVIVDTHASPRKYYRFGNLLLGFTHGDQEKESSLPMIMATDIPSKPLWSQTKFHEWHVGHIHRKRNVKYELNKVTELNENLGVTIRYLSSLTGTEEWHHKKGFIGNNKAADAFIWNYEYGLVAHINTNIIID